ncbi:MAG: hypothetical protein ACI92E_002170 [Oceanicoccus sp.]|jgi:hypothetical protein
MKNKLRSKLLAVFVGMATVSASSIAEETVMKKHIYSGDSKAVGICKSIVQDNAIKMRALLHYDQRNRHSNEAADILFTCNNNNLYVFAVDMDAKKSQKQLLQMDRNRGFYKKGNVLMEEIAAR